MLAALQGLIGLIGRVMLCAIFIASVAMNKIPNFETVAQDLAAKGVPSPKIVLAGAVVFLIVGSVSLIVGYWSRFGALLLLIVLGAMTYWFHAFWTIEDLTLRQAEMVEFIKNVSIGGALVVILANGGGAWSLDECCQTTTPPAEEPAM